MNQFSHFDERGNARMVDVTDKEITERSAIAAGTIRVSHEVFEIIKENKSAKGDVLLVARIAGIMGAKKTSELIPMCHPLMLTKVTLDFTLNDKTNEITAICTAKLAGRTGVEMEALTGVNIALLTIYDMCKAVDKRMTITNVHLMEKTGGKSGHFQYGGDSYDN